MTDLLYLPDADDVTTFTATVTEATPEYVVLDGTYFYPEGGGQPPDHGTIAWDGGRAEVRDVRKDHGDVRHDVDDMTGEPPAAGTTVEGRVDGERRDALRRMHTAQHVVSRVVLDTFDATTAGNQVHVDRSRVDFEPADVDPLRVVEIEDFDMCPCGGTHVSRLGEIGRVEVVDCTSKGAEVDRIEFELRESVSG